QPELGHDHQNNSGGRLWIEKPWSRAISEGGLRSAEWSHSAPRSHGKPAGEMVLRASDSSGRAGRGTKDFAPMVNLDHLGRIPIMSFLPCPRLRVAEELDKPGAAT